MKFISTKVHGVLDYVMGLLLVAAPWLLGFADNPIARNVTMAFGLVMLLYSLCTRYELGVFRILPIEWHIVLDIASGLLLAASPWLFKFGDDVSAPHQILGLLEIFAAIMTKRVPNHFAHAGRKYP